MQTEAGKRLLDEAVAVADEQSAIDFIDTVRDTPVIDAIEAEAYDKGMIDGGKIVVEARRGLEAAYERKRIRAAVEALDGIAFSKMTSVIEGRAVEWPSGEMVNRAAVLAILDAEASDA